MAAVRAQEASSSTSRYTYDVFLSFRGEDTRKTFTDHLYTALVQAGFRTFRDNDEIVRGESIRPELQKAIQQSRVSIIVLSKNYAFSTWCLDELVMILECKMAFGHVVLPVFYDVDPPELRKQKGRTAEAFVGYVEKFKLEKVKAWRRALKEVADLAGMELKNQADGHQSKFIQKILKVIEDKLSRTPLHVAPYLVGMHSRAERINMWVQDGSTDVSVLGICGMGGIGKTTIAKFVYNHNSTSFAGSSFLANINEVSKQPNGLVSLQRQLISDISNRKQKKIHNVDEGIIKIKNAVCCKRVLLVFDDVDQHDQLYAVRGTQDWLFPGSKIIITTRNEGLLKPQEVYKVQDLDHGESIKLFSLHAFGEECPTESYIEHTERAVRICEGLPLALQVLGSSLSGKDADRWVNELEKLEAIPHSKIVEKLKISYDSLQDDYDKRLFLHIACFFVGKGKDYTVQILDKCDLHSKVGIQNLIDRCLLTIDSSNKLMMHQLLQEMGREIVRQESLVPGERSRLWHNEDAFSVLKNETGTKTIEGLTLDMCTWKENVNNAKKRRYEEFCDKSLLSRQRNSLKRRCLSFFLGKPVSIALRSPNDIDLTLRTDAFEKMKMLCLLQLYYVHLTGCYKNFPKSLRLLCWHGFPLKSVPTDLSLENLVALDMRYSKLEQVWKGYKFLGSLKILNLSYSEGLARTPNFLGSPNLERLIFKGCVHLVEICESIECLGKLVLLNLKDCKSLRKLPTNIHLLISLEKLIISGCSRLVEFPMNMTSMESLQVLHADGIAINAIFTTTRQVNSWHAFFPSWVSKPRINPNTFVASLPRTMLELSLTRCSLSEDSFPSTFSNLSLLKTLDLSYNLFGTLPDCVKSLGNLKFLRICSCRMLHSVLGLPSSLVFLQMGFSDSVKTVTFQSTQSQIAEAWTAECKNLDEIEGVFKIEPIGKVDKTLINNMGIDIGAMENIELQFRGLQNSRTRPIQGLHEFGIFSTFIPGGAVPSCFTDKNKGSSISFTVSSLSNLTIRCLNVCSLYYRDPNGELDHPLLTKINNKTKDLTWIYSPLCWGCPNEDEDLAWLSQWNFGNQLQSGDEVTVSIFMGDLFKVKECSINIVYEEQEENENEHDSTYFSWNEVVGGDLSSFRLSTGAYFLCRHSFDYPRDQWETDLLRETFREIADLEEIERLNMRCAVKTYW